jgi:hypothetical protein
MIPALAFALVMFPTDALPLPLPECAHLPPHATCVLLATLANEDIIAIDARLALTGGWQRRELQDLRCEAVRVLYVWRAVAQATDTGTRTNYYYLCQEWLTRQQCAQVLRKVLGDEAFWRGDVPLPLSLR